MGDVTVTVAHTCTGTSLLLCGRSELRQFGAIRSTAGPVHSGRTSVSQPGAAGQHGAAASCRRRRRVSSHHPSTADTHTRLHGQRQSAAAEHTVVAGNRRWQPDTAADDI